MFLSLEIWFPLNRVTFESNPVPKARTFKAIRYHAERHSALVQIEQNSQQNAEQVSTLHFCITEKGRTLCVQEAAQKANEQPPGLTRHSPIEQMDLREPHGPLVHHQPLRGLVVPGVPPQILIMPVLPVDTESQTQSIVAMDTANLQRKTLVCTCTRTTRLEEHNHNPCPQPAIRVLL